MPSLKKSFWKKLIKSIRLWPLSRLKKYLKSRQKVFTRIDKHLKTQKRYFASWLVVWNGIAIVQMDLRKSY